MAPLHPADTKHAAPVRVIHGPNLNLLGARNPEVYGSITLEQVNAQMTEAAKPLGLALTFHQSNHEGEIIDWIHMAIATTQGLIINPGGLTHTSVALGDALEAYPHPCIEVHISNIYRREEFRHHSFVSPHATGVICGVGTQGYSLAVKAMADLLRHESSLHSH